MKPPRLCSIRVGWPRPPMLCFVARRSRQNQWLHQTAATLFSEYEKGHKTLDGHGDGADRCRRSLDQKWQAAAGPAGRAAELLSWRLGRLRRARRAWESVEEALVRELREELGVIPTAFEVVAVVDEPDPARYGPGKHTMFGVHEWTGDPTNLGVEHSEIRWFRHAELEALDLASPEYVTLFARYA